MTPAAAVATATRATAIVRLRLTAAASLGGGRGRCRFATGRAQRVARTCPLSCAMARLPLAVLALACPRGLGMGDAKLAAVMGLYLGWSVAPALLVAFGAGAVAGSLLVAREGALARRRAIPFAPFLALGGLVALCAGHGMIDWNLTSFAAAR